MAAPSKIWHQSVHGLRPQPYNLGQRLWHGSPTWAKVGAVGTSVSLEIMQVEPLQIGLVVLMRCQAIAGIIIQAVEVTDGNELASLNVF